MHLLRIIIVNKQYKAVFTLTGTLSEVMRSVAKPLHLCIRIHGDLRKYEKVS